MKFDDLYNSIMEGSLERDDAVMDAEDAMDNPKGMPGKWPLHRDEKRRRRVAGKAFLARKAKEKASSTLETDIIDAYGKDTPKANAALKRARPYKYNTPKDPDVFKDM